MMAYSEYCPRLFTMVQKGIEYHDHKIDLRGNITCTKVGNFFVRAYKYEGFKEDYMLA